MAFALFTPVALHAERFWLDFLYLFGYKMPVTNSFIRSTDFDRWLMSLRDDKGKARIVARLASAVFGNFGDSQPIGEGVSEMRIHVGPGYRVYFMRGERTVYVLLAGGDKTSQKRDIARALGMARELKETWK